ncbi:MAG: DNA adenine methylase [Ruminococcus sp.]|nr:DNA adenine methylase [Ruminococcus sp.]
MKSFIGWIGGKSLLAKRIIAEFPNNFDRYIEVFGGGGSVLLSKDKHADLEVYNDANSELVNLFRCMKYHRIELEREIDGYINSREVFKDLKSRLENGTGFTDIQRAGMFTEKYYDIKFTEDDHLRLKNTLEGIKGKFVLSYNDDEFVQELYKNYNIIKASRQNNLSSGDYKEVIIKNF